MNFDMTELSPGESYHLMIQSLIPRPIAWVLSENENGSYNLAPFSYFNAIGGTPPVFMVSSGYKSNGERKDTWKNIERAKKYVVHIPSVEHARAVTDSAYEFENGESEVSALGLETESVDGWELPKLKGVKVAFYCTHFETQLIGEKKQGLILGQIQKTFVDDSAVTEENGRTLVDAMAVNPLARLGGNNYARLGEVLTVPRAKDKPGQ